MGLSSKLATCVAFGALAATALVAAPVAARPATIAVHPGLSRTVGPAIRGRVAGRGLRGRGFGGGYLGEAGAALGTEALLGPEYVAQNDYQLPPGAVAPPEPPPLPPVPACPMIIKIGPGLDHPVQTRVIYGAPACR